MLGIMVNVAIPALGKLAHEGPSERPYHEKQGGCLGRDDSGLTK